MKWWGRYVLLTIIWWWSQGRFPTSAWYRRRLRCFKSHWQWFRWRNGAFPKFSWGCAKNVGVRGAKWRRWPPWDILTAIEIGRRCGSGPIRAHWTRTATIRAIIAIGRAVVAIGRAVIGVVALNWLNTVSYFPWCTFFHRWQDLKLTCEKVILRNSSPLVCFRSERFKSAREKCLQVFVNVPLTTRNTSITLEDITW